LHLKILYITQKPKGILVIETVFQKTDGSYRWIDIVMPTRDELQQVSLEFGLHATTIQDCLDPEHLPKYEKLEENTFIICRAYDEGCTAEADTIQELTRKMAIMYGKDFLITIHRVDQPFLQSIRDRWRVAPNHSNKVSFFLLHELFLAILQSYEMPLHKAMRSLDIIENEVFHKSDKQHLEDLYYLKRKANVFKEMFYLSRDILRVLTFESKQYLTFLQDLRENADRLFFLSQQLYESANNLLNLHISLSAHRTNEVMRILTLFSVFFMPLTFIVGVYGMNFEHMPELGWKFGYLITWTIIVLVALSLYIWFRRRGWLR
jgi:magnesium transporter